MVGFVDPVLQNRTNMVEDHGTVVPWQERTGINVACDRLGGSWQRMEGLADKL